MATLFLKNVKTGKLYQVVAVDRAKGKITLRGKQYEFTEKYDVNQFKAWGYALVTADAA